MKTIEDLKKYDTSATHRALYSQIEIEHLDAVKSILRKEKLKVTFKFRGPRDVYFREPIRHLARAFSVYPRKFVSASEKRTTKQREIDTRKSNYEVYISEFKEIQNTLFESILNHEFQSDYVHFFTQRKMKSVLSDIENQIETMQEYIDKN